MKLPRTEPAAEAGLAAFRRIYRWLALALAVGYAFSGVSIVRPGEIGLVRRFGRWTGVTGAVDIHLPGLLFAWPAPVDEVTRLPIKQEFRVDIEAVRGEPTDHQKGPANKAIDCITGDQNAVEISALVKYRVVHPARYAIAFRNPTEVIQQVANAALTGTVNSWSIDEVLQLQRPAYRCDDQSVAHLRETFGDRFKPELWRSLPARTVSAAELIALLRHYAREPASEDHFAPILAVGQFTQSLTDEVLSRAQRRLSELATGVELTAVELRSVRPPHQVEEAFLAVQSVRVDQESWRSEATGERIEAILAAETLASQFIADANGRLSSRVAQATGEAVLFEAALNAYEGSAPDETAERMRRDAWERILAGAGRVLVVPKHGRSGQIRLSVPELENRR